MTSKSDKVDVTFSAGWLRCRLAAVDETTGEEQTVPGVHSRIRVADIRAYHIGGPGVLVLWITGLSDGIEVIGSLSALDKIMERAHLREVQGDNTKG